MIAADLADSMDADKLSEDQSEAVSMVTALRSAAPALPQLPCHTGTVHPTLFAAVVFMSLLVISNSSSCL